MAHENPTPQDLISHLWRKCMTTARNEGHVPAEAVQSLINQSREVLAKYGATKRRADSVLSLIYAEIHWDWNQPTDRIFETMLDFELAEFFKERMGN